MASIFKKDSTEQPASSPYGKELIEKEIEHLRKPKSTRQSPNERVTVATLVTFLLLFVVFALYAWDPFIFAWQKDDAIRTYLYMHNYDNQKNTQPLIACGILSEEEIQTLDAQKGSYEDYFPSADLAEQKAKAIEDYMQGVHDLHEGNWNQLGILGKIRWVLFYRAVPIGTPIQWDILSPKVE